MSSTSPSKRAPTVTLPERLELEYMLSQRRLVRDLAWLTVASLSKFREDQRQDSDELLAWLGLSAPQALDEAQLRRRLRLIGVRLTHEKLQELSTLLGWQVRAPRTASVEKWIDAQVLAIQSTIDNWLVAAGEEIRRSRLHGMAMADMTVTLRTLQSQAGERAERRASAAILQLNSQLIEETARGAGSTHYRWMTEDDGRVRDWHMEKHGDVFSWDSPPAGGGSHKGDAGHPGSGYGCRCVPVPIQGKPQKKF